MAPGAITTAVKEGSWRVAAAGASCCELRELREQLERPLRVACEESRDSGSCSGSGCAIIGEPLPFAITVSRGFDASM